ncbi:MAG TPA: MATE family efflux transporter [Thermoanaerobaculia bacterium]|nr:MATE family efflux transporter [Thermoanaerobaculia bacterium]
MKPKRELGELLRLAAPLAAAQAGTQLMGVVDTAVVGRLGALELGAVGLGNTIFFAISIVGMGIVMGIDPLASQAYGAGELVRARRVLWQGVWLSVIVGAVLMIPMSLSPLLLSRLAIDPAVVTESNAYVQVRMLSLVPALLFIVVRSYLQAKGITRPMVTAMVVGNIFNLIADIVFVFGGSVLPAWSGPLQDLPAFGVTGAAIATLLGSFVQLAIIAEGVRRLPVAGFVAEMRRPSARDLRQAFGIGLPVGLQWGAEVGIFALVALLAGRFGNQELAAHQIAITLASFTFTVALGVGAAGSVRVGQSIGARDQAATRTSGMVAFAAGCGVMSLSALMFLLFPRQLASILTNDTSVLAVAVPLLAVAAVFQISDGVQAIGAGVLRGAGDTRFAFFANIIGHWLIGFPVAIALGFSMRLGIVGLWWGLCAGLSAVALLLFLRFVKLSSRPIIPL